MLFRVVIEPKTSKWIIQLAGGSSHQEPVVHQHQPREEIAVTRPRFGASPRLVNA